MDRKKDMILPRLQRLSERVRMWSPCIRACWKWRSRGAVQKSGEAVKIFAVKGSGLTAEAMMRIAGTTSPATKVPSHVEFRSELPKTNVGKILRRRAQDGAAGLIHSRFTRQRPALRWLRHDLFVPS